MITFSSPTQPLQPAASPARTPGTGSSPALSQDVLPGNLRAPGDARAAGGVEAAACRARSSPRGPPVPQPPARLPPCPGSSLQPEPAEAGKPTSRQPSAEPSARKPSEMLSGPASRELAERTWSSSVHLTPRPWPSSRTLAPPLRFLRRYLGPMRRCLKTLQQWFSSEVTAPRGQLAASGDSCGCHDSGRVLLAPGGGSQGCSRLPTTPGGSLRRTGRSRPKCRWGRLGKSRS